MCSFARSVAILDFTDPTSVTVALGYLSRLRATTSLIATGGTATITSFTSDAIGSSRRPAPRPEATTAWVRTRSRRCTTTPASLSAHPTDAPTKPAPTMTAGLIPSTPTSAPDAPELADLGACPVQHRRFQHGAVGEAAGRQL